MLNMLPQVIAEGMAPIILATIHLVETPMLLDSGAQISVLKSSLVVDFDLPISLPSVTRKVRTFGNHQVTLRGPLTLDFQLRDFRIRHPFYFIDAPSLAIGGYDLMQADRLVIDVANRRVWSRRSESATKNQMTAPERAHRIVVSASQKRRQQVRDDPPTDLTVEPRASPVPPRELFESVTDTDIDQPDVKRANVIESGDEEDVTATVAEINQCYQDHVDAVRSAFLHFIHRDVQLAY